MINSHRHTHAHTYTHTHTHTHTHIKNTQLECEMLCSHPAHVWQWVDPGSLEVSQHTHTHTGNHTHTGQLKGLCAVDGIFRAHQVPEGLGTEPRGHVEPTTGAAELADQSGHEASQTQMPRIPELQEENGPPLHSEISTSPSATGAFISDGNTRENMGVSVTTGIGGARTNMVTLIHFLMSEASGL